MFSNILGWLKRRSNTSLVAIGVLLVLLVSAIDALTPAEMAFTPFYLIPILIVTWFAGTRPGFFIAVVCAMAWSIVEMIQQAPKETLFIMSWNAMCRVGVLLVVVFLVWAIRTTNEGLEGSIERRTAELKAGIAEHQRTEDLLRANEELFRQLTMAIDQVFWMTTPDKNELIYISPAYEKIWGRTCESNYAVPKSWLEAIHPEDRERIVKVAMTQQVDGEYDYEYRIVRPDGSIRWIQDRAFPIRDVSGKVYRIAGIAQDITERKQAELQLTTLAHAVESTSELICITDLQDRLIFVNQAFQKVHGYTEAEILSKTPEVLHSPRNPPMLIGELRKQTRLGGWQGEVLDLRKDGSEFPIHLNTSLIKDPDGRVIGLLGVARDITEAKRAEQSLHLLGSAVEQSKESIVITDAELDLPGPRILFVNPAFTKMTGYTAEEVLGKTPRILQGARTDKAVLSRLRQTIAKGEPFLGETINYRKDGAEFYLEWQVTPIRDAYGTTTHFLAIQRDITERKLAETRMATLAHAVESTAEMICITDLQDRFIFVNQAFQQAYGYEEREILGKTPDILFSSSNPPKVVGEILKQTRLGGWHGEILDRRKDGTEFPVSLSTSQVRDEFGDIISLMGVARDITERRKSEDALLASEERFRKAFGAAPVAMVIASVDGHFLQVNQAFCEMLGYTEQELLAKTISDVTYPGDLDITNRYIERSLKEEKVSSVVEKRYLHKGGNLVWGRSTASLIHDKSRRPLHFIVHIQDVTDRKRLEREILEISDREQGRIGQDLHDGLCQQLVSAAFASNRLGQTLATAAPSEADTAKEIAGWLDEAISQARALARGLYPVKLEVDGLASALQELAEYVSDRFGTTCVFECPEAVLLADNAVATHMYRIAQEAVTNAVKHSQGNRILIKLTGEGGTISVSVEDDGIGIPEVITSGLGSHIMQYRTRMIGGALTIARGSNSGTVVICSFHQ
jgi:PAS domain S-box-containing protein